MLFLLFIRFFVAYATINVCSTVSIVLVTSLVPSAPNVTLVETSLASLRRLSCLASAEAVISLHVPPSRSGDGRAAQYRQNLLRLVSGLTNTRMIVSEVENAETAFARAITAIRTPLYLLWEHDWVFCRQVPLEDILLEMQSDASINYVRFNQRHNVVTPFRFDSHLVPYPSRFAPLLFTPSWSNNPHVARHSFFTQRCLPFLDRVGNRSTRMGFLEVPLTNQIRRSLTCCGVDAARADWGTFLYGHLGDPQVLAHLDGRKQNDISAPSQCS